jgi:parallel beta-helix repeat protein
MVQYKYTTVAMVILTALICCVSIAGATTWTVHPTDPAADYTTIQTAIDSGTDGDYIEVWNSTYYEHVTVNKELTLYSRDGADVTIVDGSNTGKVFYVTENNATIDDFTVRNGNYGIHLYFADNCNITNSTITSHNYYAIYMYGANYNNINDNEVISNGYDGIYLYQSDDNTISNNNASMHTNHAGIYLHYYNDNNTLYNNTASSNR